MELDGAVPPIRDGAKAARALLFLLVALTDLAGKRPDMADLRWEYGHRFFSHSQIDFASAT
jgi:hypothetical protein